MKKYLLITYLICFMSAFGGEYRKTVILDPPGISKNGRYDQVVFPGTQSFGQTGGPALPYFALEMLLPPGERALEIRIDFQEEMKLEGEILLAPWQPAYPLSDQKKHPVQFDPEQYASLNPLPESASGKLTTQVYRGCPVTLTTWCPVRYTPGSRQLSWFRKVNILLITEKVESPNPLKIKASDLAWMKKHYSNAEVLNMLPVDPPDTSDYQVLLISPDLFLNQLEDFRDVYRIQGMKSRVVSLTTIVNQISGLDNPEKIRNYILQEYQQHDIQHVVLVGDAELMPVRGLYCQVQSSSVYTDNGIPADLYYSALDGNWNTDGDGYWGEPGEEDLLPDISVGRLTVSTLTDLNNLRVKTLNYQLSPVIPDLRKPLLAGEKLWDNPVTWGGNFMDLLIGDHTDNGYTTHGIPTAHDEETLYDRDLPVPWTASDLLAEINSGHSFLHHVGHANTGYLMRMYTSGVTDAAFSQVNGIEHSFMPVYTHGCYCGSFDIGDCIAEKMLNIQRFCNVFVGNSRYGWFNEGQTEGPSEHLHREFVDAMYFDSISSVGWAHSLSKIASAPWVTAPGQWEEGALRWCVYTCNVLGDPVLNLWTDQPRVISVQFPDTLQAGSPGFTVLVNEAGMPAGGIRATLVQNSSLLAYSQTNTAGEATLSFILQPDTGWAMLVFSGYNCLPDTHAIYISGQSGISGYLTYQNTAQTPLSNTVIRLLLNGTVVSVDTTASDGAFSLPFSQAGNYTFEYSCPLSWGGVNSTDALEVLKHFVNMIQLQGLALSAADVDASQFVNAADALSIQKRFVGLLANFAGGNWKFSHSGLNIPTPGQYSLLIKGLCAGDVNGSFVPLN